MGLSVQHYLRLPTKFAPTLRIGNTLRFEGDSGSEPLNSSLGRVYLYPKTEQIINCAMGLKHPIDDIEALKKAFSDSVMLKHPKFCSLVIKDQNGADRWERVQVNINDHIIVHHPNTAKTRLQDEDEVEAEINAYLADISVSTPLSEKKPLWEVHVLMGLKCVVLRVHHALGDGASLMSMLNACFGEKSGSNNRNTNYNVISNNYQSNSKKDENVWDLVQALWLTSVFGSRLVEKILLVKDEPSVISGGDGVEMWPRKLVTVKFKLEDFKRIKKAIPSATINDVLLGAISSGLSKYLEIKSPKAASRGLDVTALVLVDLRKGRLNLFESTSDNSSSWGNKTGIVFQPIHCCNGLHPIEHVKNVKAIMDQKKKSYEANVSLFLLEWLTFSFGPKVAMSVYHQLLCNTTLAISNIVGPSEELVIGNNPVTSLRVNVSSVPQAMTMHFVSYKGNADLQLMVARHIIHDPELLANCIKSSLDEMKNLLS